MMYGKIKTSAPRTPAVKAAKAVPFGVVRRPQTPESRPVLVAGEGVMPPPHRRAFYGKSLFF